jgi:hypothetical protein
MAPHKHFHILLLLLITQSQFCTICVHADEEKASGRLPQWKIAFEKQRKKRGDDSIMMKGEEVVNEEDISRLSATTTAASSSRIPAWKKALEKKKLSRGQGDVVGSGDDDSATGGGGSDGSDEAGFDHRLKNKHLLRTHVSLIQEDVSLNENWKAWKQPRFIVKTPGQLALQSIQVFFFYAVCTLYIYIYFK